MSCLSPILLRKNNQYVKCGSCIHCIRKARDKWVLRALLEVKATGPAVFITLTYDELGLPENESVSKDHMRRFHNRVQIYFRTKYGIRFRYFTASEYGTKGTKRPHYHIIGFGTMPFKDSKPNTTIYKEIWDSITGSDNRVDVQIVGENKIKQLDYVNPDKIVDIRSHSELVKSMTYVTKYMFKDISKDVLGGRTKPFTLKSQGLGLSYIPTFAKHLRKKDIFPFHMLNSYQRFIYDYFVFRKRSLPFTASYDGLFAIQNDGSLIMFNDKNKEEVVDRFKKNKAGKIFTLDDYYLKKLGAYMAPYLADTVNNLYDDLSRDDRIYLDDLYKEHQLEQKEEQQYTISYNEHVSQELYDNKSKNRYLRAKEAKQKRLDQNKVKKL